MQGVQIKKMLLIQELLAQIIIGLEARMTPSSSIKQSFSEQGLQGSLPI